MVHKAEIILLRYTSANVLANPSTSFSMSKIRTVNNKGLSMSDTTVTSDDGQHVKHRVSATEDEQRVVSMKARFLNETLEVIVTCLHMFI